MATTLAARNVAYLTAKKKWGHVIPSGGEDRGRLALREADPLSKYLMSFRTVGLFQPLPLQNNSHYTPSVVFIYEYVAPKSTSRTKRQNWSLFSVTNCDWGHFWTLTCQFKWFERASSRSWNKLHHINHYLHFRCSHSTTSTKFTFYFTQFTGRATKKRLKKMFLLSHCFHSFHPFPLLPTQKQFSVTYSSFVVILSSQSPESGCCNRDASADLDQAFMTNAGILGGAESRKGKLRSDCCIVFYSEQGVEEHLRRRNFYHGQCCANKEVHRQWERYYIRSDVRKNMFIISIPAGF